MKFDIDSSVRILHNSFFIGDESQEHAGQTGTVVRVIPGRRHVMLPCGPAIWCDTRELEEVQAGGGGGIARVAEAARHYAAALVRADVVRVECAQREAELEEAAQSLLDAAKAYA